MTIETTPAVAAAPSSPTDRLLTASLVAAPLVYLAADTTYAARGWEADGTGGALAVLGSILYGLALLAVAGSLPRASLLRAVAVLTAVVGAAGNVAYGFDAIHVSLGDVSLVDRSGAATLIKPLGLCFPLALLVAAVALARLGRHMPAALVALGAVVFPIAHIGNVAWLAVAGNVALVLGFCGLPWTRDKSAQRWMTAQDPEDRHG
jgi:hypothetical protein